MTLTINLRLVLSLTGLALCLAACGGGSDDNDADLRSKDLYTAYEVVSNGMSLPELEAVVGVAPSSDRLVDGASVRMYTWVADKGSYLETRLHVNVEAGYGAVAKSITGPSGGESEQFK